MQNKDIISKIKQFINENKHNNLATICVFSPYFENANEGYLQRVRAVDEKILHPHACIHIDFESHDTEPTLYKKSPRHLLLNLPSHQKKSINFAIKIIKLCKILYVHSAMRAMHSRLGDGFEKMFTQKNVYTFWDVHGAVPEEYVLFKNYYEAQNATYAEELLLKNANSIVVISENMKLHFENKYNTKLSNTINTSVFNVSTNTLDSIISTKPKEIKNFVYAGNAMPWQNVELMKDVIYKNHQNFNFTVFTHQKEQFLKSNYIENFESFCDITTATSSEVLDFYKTMHFGFIIRDDIAVNRVACPTKIIEYLQFGLIPILKSDNIGDFLSLGMIGVNYNEINNFDFSYENYLNIVKHNFLILEKLAAEHSQAVNSLKTILNDLITKGVK